VEFHDYFPVPDDANTRFWAEYYQLAQEIAPALQMEKPRPRPAGSYCVTCTMELVRKHGLPRCEVVHWLPLGKVKLWVAGLGECIDAVAPVVEPLLGADMYLQRAGKSLAVTVDVPELNVQQPFASQRGAAEKGLVAALRLQKWQHENAAALQQIATAIGEKRP